MASHGELRLPPPPTSAGVVVGDALERVTEYARLLVSHGIVRGLLGPGEVDRVWERHILNCAVLAPALPQASSLIDVGSGAGLPGLVLAIVRPDVRTVLVEPLLRRATFLTECVAALRAENVTVMRARAEEVQARGLNADTVTARAVAPLERLLPMCVPLARRGGVVLAMKGGRAEDELAQVRRRLLRWGIRDATVVRYGEGLLDTPTVVVRCVVSSQEARPRRASDRRSHGGPGS